MDNQLSDQEKEKFDEKQYQHYEDIRSKMKLIFDDITDLHKSKIQLGSADEVW